MTSQRQVPRVSGRGLPSGRTLEQFLALKRQLVNEEDKLAICARVREARIKAGLTEIEIAEMLDPPVVDRTIRNYETVRPPFRYLRQWAEITGAPYEWLLRGDEPPPEPAKPPEDLSYLILGELRQLAADVRALTAVLAERQAPPPQ